MSDLAFEIQLNSTNIERFQRPTISIIRTQQEYKQTNFNHLNKQTNKQTKIITMDSFEFWLRRMESKLERNARRPTTREDADDLWKITKVGLESRYLPMFCLFLTEEIQYHDGLRSRELGQAPILLCGPNS